MKKKIAITAAAVAALVATISCQHDETMEVNNGESITFRAFTDNATRAVDVTQDGDNALASFKVFAFGNAEASQYDWDDTFTGSGNNWTTQSGMKYYWPGDGTQLNFFAYNESEVTGSATATIERNGTTPATIDASIEMTPDRDATNQKDLVVAYVTGSNNSNASSAVNINFKHALSKITVKAENAEPNTYEIEIKGINLCRYDRTGVLTMPVATTDASYVWNENAWTTSNTADNANYYKVRTGTNAIVLDGKQGIPEITVTDGKSNPFMVVPQKKNAWTTGTELAKDDDLAYFSILCRIYQKDGKGGKSLIFPRPDSGQSIEELDGKFGLASVGITSDWKPGINYTYTLSFFKDGGGAGTTDPAPDPNPDPDVDPENPDIPVVGGEIKWNVTVDAWTTGDDTNLKMDGTEVN